jgi:hypothetical protein
MRYGNVHRCVECPELCKEVPVLLRPRLRSTIVECKLDMRDDGPDKENRSKPSRAGVTLAATTLPVPRLHRKPRLHRIFIMQRDICKHAAARVESFRCALEMTFAYPLIVSRKSFLEAVKFPEISEPDV